MEQHAKGNTSAERAAASAMPESTINPVKLRVEIELALIGKTSAQAAREIGVTQQHFNYVMRGRTAEPVWQDLKNMLGVDPRYEITEAAQVLVRQVLKPPRRKKNA